jgi:hypothetical protein
MPENRTNATTLSVTAYVDALTGPTVRSGAKELVQFMQRASGEKPKLRGPFIVGFGSYHYKYDSGREGDMRLNFNLPLCFWLPIKLFLGQYGRLSKFLFHPRCCAEHRSASRYYWCERH